MLHRFWVHVIWLPKLKISVWMYGRKIWVLCKLWWMVAAVQKFHYEALKTLKMLQFSILRQWTIGSLSIWTLPGGSQLSMHPGCWLSEIVSSGFIVLCMFIVIIKWKHRVSRAVLEQFGNVSSIFGACNLGAKIKDLLSRPYQVPFLNYWTWTKKTPQKNCLFWSNPSKIEVMITSLIEIL